jgi:hypothetical protein
VLIYYHHHHQHLELHYLSLALPTFIGPWPLVQFPDLIHGRYDSLDGDQLVSRPLPAHSMAQTYSKRTQTPMPQVGFELTTPVFQRAKTVQALDRAATVIGLAFHRPNQIRGLLVPAGCMQPIGL